MSQPRQDITAVLYNLMSVIRRAAIEDCCRHICAYCNRSLPYDPIKKLHAVTHGDRTGYVRCDATKLKGKI